ncbi:VOC family protein [Streptomyces sp. NPDC056144]|uniref:VOC family protein n=1 Tax=unclassified Streptomyces TaxID=2593676 RepID=UPI0035E23EA2
MPHDQQNPQPADATADATSEQPAKAPHIELNHTAIYSRDRRRSAEFLAGLLGLEVGAPFGPFIPVDLGNGVTLDYYEKRDEPIQSQHYAFLVPAERFDAMIAHLEAAGVTYYADPYHSRPGEVNNLFGGHGAYFLDPDGHNLEIMTVPYAR